MKVAEKSPASRVSARAAKAPATRSTLTLPSHAMELLDAMRGETPKSRYVERLLESAAAAREKDTFYARATAAYTPAVREETLALNKEFPIHDE